PGFRSKVNGGKAGKEWAEAMAGGIADISTDRLAPTAGCKAHPPNSQGQRKSMSLGSRAASWFAPFTFVLAVLCQRIQTLGTRIALAIDYPSGVGLYPCLVASRGLPRPRPRGGTLYIRNAPLGATEKFLLFSAMRTPGSAVEFGVGAGEMFRQAADPRIFRTRRFAYIPCVVKMQRDDNEQGRTHRFDEPRAPGKAGQMSGLLEKQGDENRRHQRQ